MADNFKILTHRTSDMLYLRLIGDFDVISATNLLDMLKENMWGIDGIYIDASKLERIHPYGQNMIKENLSWISDIEPYVFISGGVLGQPCT